jgi:DNA-binding response OmpR family regulator
VKQGRILIVDDDEEWRTEVVETLRREGYLAETAPTEDQALAQLDTKLFHLAILDICLQDDNPNNTDGITLLHELKNRNLGETVKVIMLSDHDTKEHLRTTFRDYSVVDFLSKGEFNKKILLDEVREAFTERMNINLSLNIRWQIVNGPEDAVLNLAISGTSVTRGTALHSLIATELEDLLCRLFHEASSIIVRPVSPGQSATGVLAVQPFYPSTGSRGTVIVKFGNLRKVEQEHANFKKYVEHALGGGRSTVVHGLRRTPHLGGIIYSFVGVANTRLEDFGSFYSHSNTTIEGIKKALDNLFLETCENWYENRSQLQPHDLSDDYRQLLNLTLEKLEYGFLALGDSVSVFKKEKLQFQSLSTRHIFTNPLAVVTDRPWWISTYICTTHGDFNTHNILLDDNDNTWLIDFLRTGQGHILRDVSELDSVVRFELLAGKGATLDERLTMEEALCSIDRFSQLERLGTNFSTENEALAKTFATVVHLRKLAGMLLRRSSHEDMEEFYVALFFHALNTLRFDDLSLTQREHALLCASLLADKLHLN